MTCSKSQEFLAKHAVEVIEKVAAKTSRLGPSDALKLARDADRVVVARGKKVATFDMKKKPPDRSMLLEHLLGPTGNLRAPALRIGRTLLIGFDPATYAQILKSDPR